MASVTFDPAVGGDGSTVDDTTSPVTGLGAGGHRTRFVPALAQIVTIAAFVVTKAAQAAASAVTATGAASTAAGYKASSTTSLTVGTGAQTLTIQAGKSFTAGQPVALINTGTPANAMYGTVTSYNSGSGALVVAVDYTTGAVGPFTAWDVVVSGPRGATGPISTAFADVSSPTAALAVATRNRLTARITAGTLPASPGVGGGVIEIYTATDASVNYHTFTPNGAETVTVAGVAGSPFQLDAAQGQIIRLIPIAGGWEMGQ